MLLCCSRFVAVGAIVLGSELCTAQEAELPSVRVTGNYNNAVGTSDAASQGTVTAKLLGSRPTLRPAEVLEFVPGVIVSRILYAALASATGLRLDLTLARASVILIMTVMMSVVSVTMMTVSLIISSESSSKHFSIKDMILII